MPFLVENDKRCKLHVHRDGAAVVRLQNFDCVSPIIEASTSKAEHFTMVQQITLVRS